MQEQEHWRRLLLRTEETATIYEEAQKNSPKTNGCRLCNDKETIKKYEHWRLVPNAFPYDRFFSKSVMLISNRHTDENGLTEEEVAEFRKLKNTEFSDEYDLLFENMPVQKSIPHHIHYHIVQIKKPN